MKLSPSRLLAVAAALCAGSAGAQDVCSLAGGAEPVRIVSEGGPLQLSLRSGEIVHARSISLARGMARVDSESFGTLELACASVAAISKATHADRVGHLAPMATLPPLSAIQADAMRGRGADTSAPARSGNPPPPVIRPELEEALRRAELLRNRENPQVGLGRVRLTSGFNLGLSSSAGNRSQELGVSQQVSYGWTDNLSVFGSIGYARVSQESLNPTGAGATPVFDQTRSGDTAYAAGVSYRLNRPTDGLPEFTLTGLVGVPARAARILDQSSVGAGHRSGTIRLEAGREYDSVSWTVGVFATSFLPQTISDSKVQPGLQSGVDFFGALMLNDRYSVSASVRFTDRQRATIAGVGLPGSDRQGISTEYGFVSELTRGQYLSVRIGNLLGTETNAASVGASLTFEF